MCIILRIRRAVGQRFPSKSIGNVGKLTALSGSPRLEEAYWFGEDVLPNCGRPAEA
jgi:hypothetical protein